MHWLVNMFNPQKLVNTSQSLSCHDNYSLNNPYNQILQTFSSGKIERESFLLSLYGLKLKFFFDPEEAENLTTKEVWFHRYP